MTKRIRVAQVGLGAMGRRLTPFLVERPWIEVVAAVDPAPGMAGRDLGEVSGLGRQLGVTVRSSAAEALAVSKAEVALLTTVSTLAAVRPQLEELMARRLHIVSSCEELSYPWQTAPQWSTEVDRLAKQAGVAVLGTGVNPGFLMDLLPLALTAICRDVQKVTVMRHQDASHRRLPFQQKIGAGLTPEQFAMKVKDGSLRHVGLTESMHLIASRLGWTLTRTEDAIEPVIADREVRSEQITVRPGLAAGVQQYGRGWVEGEERILLDFRAAIGQEEPHDTVLIKGTPPLRATIAGGVNGDVATCAILTNAISTVLAAAPGLHTMADIPPVSWRA
jgi:hypothetical protein